MLSGFVSPRRVVISGFGYATPIGMGRDEYWTSLKSGKSVVRRIESFDASKFEVQIAAEIPEFDWKSELNPKDRQHVPRTVPLVLAAAREAVRDSAVAVADLLLDERRRVRGGLGTGG